MQLSDGSPGVSPVHSLVKMHSRRLINAALQQCVCVVLVWVWVWVRLIVWRCAEEICSAFCSVCAGCCRQGDFALLCVRCLLIRILIMDLGVCVSSGQLRLPATVGVAAGHGLRQ